MNEVEKVITYDTAKGNTLLNYTGVKNDLIKFVVNKSHSKQNRYLPASHIPVINDSNIKKFKPNYVLIQNQAQEDWKRNMKKLMS
jgi:hypothetical protein